MQETLTKLAADGLLIVIVLAGGGAGLWYLLRSQQFVHRVPYIVMAGLTSLLAGKLISLFYQPNAARPYIEQGVAAGAAYINNPGFPSDHALLATVLVLMVLLCTPYRKLAGALAVLVVIMSAARVIALVHTPLDVIGGILMGGTGALWYRRMRSPRSDQ